MSAVAAFAEKVGRDAPVVVAGGRTQWDVGGAPDPAAREVVAPAGIVAHLPEEMIVRVLAGTTVAELDAALAARGQAVALDPQEPARATVGGVLAVGHSGVRRLGWGPVRDALLEATVVTAEGTVVRAGAPLVKNVTGFDLCRLLVGSLGTLASFAEVVLRVRPKPKESGWFRVETDDPAALRRRLHHPSSILWDGRAAHVLLEGDAADVAAERATPGPALVRVDTPPRLPSRGRRSVRPREAIEVTAGLEPGTFVAEVGVGVIHLDAPEPRPRIDAGSREICDRLRDRFDPRRRLNPGRRLWEEG